MTINGDLNGVPFSCGSSCSVPLPEGVGTVNYLVTSTSGRTASGLSTWQRDSILPVLNVVLPSLNGRNGWYASDVDIAANASDTISGLHSVTGSMDEGLNWTPFPFHVSDGISHIAARARDVAGNEVAKSEMVRVDTIPPIAHFTSHSNGEVVHGSVLLTGKLMDETSGVSQGELSPDSGIGWQAGSMDAGDTLSFTWNTNDVPNGQYSLQMRGIDVAGNVGDTASIMLVVDNKPPHVSLTDRWWIWESGQLKISPNYFPIASVKVTIRDPQDRWPAAIMEFDLEKVASSIYWNRRFADETLAPSGEFRVIAVACDIHNLCSSDTGIVAIPFVATSTVTLTPSPTATLTLTPQATFTETQKLATSTVVLVTSSPRVSSDSAQPRCALSFWQLLGLLGLFLAISSASVIDPRPAAIDRLRESIKLLSVHNAVDSSKADE